jgi:Mu transposase, C-terminal domain
MTASAPEQAQASLDVFCSGTADARRRPAGDGTWTTTGALADAEPLLALPAAPYPATVIVSRTVGANAAVAFRGNSYSVPPGLAGTAAECRLRLGTAVLEIFSASGGRLSSHRLAPDGAGTLVRSAGHRAELEQVVLSAFTTARPCERKGNHPPGDTARAEAGRLLARLGPDVTVDLARYAELAGLAEVTR